MSLMTLLSLVAGQPGQAARQTSWRARCVAALSRDTARGPDQLTEYP